MTASTPERKKLYENELQGTLCVDCRLQYSFRGGRPNGDDLMSHTVTLGGFCRIDGRLYLLTYPAEVTPTCADPDDLQLHALKHGSAEGNSSWEQTSLLLAAPFETNVFVSPNRLIAAVLLRDQNSDAEFNTLMTKIGNGLHFKYIDVLSADEATVCGVEVFEGDVRALNGTAVQVAVQGLRHGTIQYVEGQDCPLVSLNDAPSDDEVRGAFVTSIGPQSNGKMTAYGIVVGCENGCLKMWPLKDALKELKAEHFPDEDIVLCNP